MTFQKGYNWFIVAAFCTGVFTLFLPEHKASPVKSNLPITPEETGTPAYSYTPSADSPKELDSRTYTSLPASDSGSVAPKKHEFENTIALSIAAATKLDMNGLRESRSRTAIAALRPETTTFPRRLRRVVTPMWMANQNRMMTTEILVQEENLSRRKGTK